MNPGFVLVVHHLQVVHRHLLLFVAIALLDAAKASVRLAAQIDDAGEWPFANGLLSNLPVNACLHWFGVAEVTHQSSKDVAVS